MKHLKIKDARIRNSKMFQEDQGMFYRKTQGTKQLKGKVPRMEKFEEFWAGICEDNTKTPKRKWMNTVAIKMGKKLRMCRNLHSPKRSYTKQSRNKRIRLLLGLMEYRIFGGKSAWSAILRWFNQWLELPDKIPDWLT